MTNANIPQHPKTTVLSYCMISATNDKTEQRPVSFYPFLGCSFSFF